MDWAGFLRASSLCELWSCELWRARAFCDFPIASLENLRASPSFFNGELFLSWEGVQLSPLKHRLRSVWSSSGNWILGGGWTIFTCKKSCKSDKNHAKWAITVTSKSSQKLGELWLRALASSSLTVFQNLRARASSSFLRYLLRVELLRARALLGSITIQQIDKWKLVGKKL